jgi:uncharacterized protein
MHSIIARIAQDIQVREHQVKAAVELLDAGATVPFIARYRKEATGGLDDVALRTLAERLSYLRELDERREVVLKAIAEQGKLTPVLQAALMAAQTKQVLEDLYLPFKLKRRTKGQLAREAGLEPLADALWADPRLEPVQAAGPFVLPAAVPVEGEPAPPDFSTPAAVLDGVRDLLAERWAEQAEILQDLREWVWAQGALRSSLRAGRNESLPEVARFLDYFDYEEPISSVPSHRAMAVFRGRSQDVLDVKLAMPEPADGSPSAAAAPSLAEGRLALRLGWSHQGRAADDFLRRCVSWTWRVKLSLSIERELFARLREQAEQVAIGIFGANVRDLLMAAPAGPRVVMGLDPGIRTGVKVAVVDGTGKLVDTTTVYPNEPRRDWDGAVHSLVTLCQRHGVSLMAIGNGTASRETDRLAAQVMARLAASGAERLDKVVVSEAGASVYSASAYASQEMPDVDVSLRGAASIARRLQDPLAELVKIDPKSIGVGQYQHDVSQSALAKTLDAVVEDCVNAVGVDLNTASVPLLSRVSGLSSTVAGALVRWREAHGAFANRQQLLQVTGLGAKTFQQCAGFLRIRGGDNPLDMTGVHPETYPVVERLLTQTQQTVAEMMGRSERLRSIRPEQLANAQWGVVTVQDILNELEKPGRDPRPDFKVARLTDGVEDISDLKVGMVLEGTVSNVAAFGAFVDLGVHQDGLVHVSQLSRNFVSDARSVVHTGDIVKVQVLEVDAARKRISLSMRIGEASPGQARAGRAGAGAGAAAGPRHPSSARAHQSAPAPTAMSSAFAKLKSLSH